MFCNNCGSGLGSFAKFCPKCGYNLSSGTAMPGTPVDSSTPASQTGSFLVSSRWRRFWTYFLDWVTVIIISFIIGFIIGIVTVALGGTEAPELSDNESFIFGLVLFFVYYIVFEGLWQRTIGKFITGTKVVMKDGSKPPFKNIIGRSLARIIPFEPFSTLANGVGWHDSLSGTLVVPKDYTEEQVRQIQPETKSRWGLIVVIIVLLI